MSEWKPGPDPFPATEIQKITEFEYLDELKFVRHAKAHHDVTPASLWQLSADFRAKMKVHLPNGKTDEVKIKAPRGMYTDLASVPDILQSFVGRVGPHLEASILHDYLYMAWTDFRGKARRIDWNFADAVLLAGMKVSKVRRRKAALIYAAVHSAIGWRVFKKKSYKLKDRMELWLPDLKASHGRNG